MIPRPIGSITKKDIDALVANGVSECRTLDYKETLPGNSDSENPRGRCDFYDLLLETLSFIDQRDVIRKILEHVGLWEEADASPDRGPPEKEITIDPSYGSINSPSRGRSRDSQIL